MKITYKDVKKRHEDIKNLLEVVKSTINLPLNDGQKVKLLKDLVKEIEEKNSIKG